MKRAAFFLLLLLLVAFAGSLHAQTCFQGRTDWLPFLGNSNPDPMVNNPTVTLYVNDAGRNNTALQGAAMAGADVWNNGCPRSAPQGQRSYSSIPQFAANWTQNRGSGNDPERRGIQIDLMDAPAPVFRNPDGSIAGLNPAHWGEGNVITVYRRCPAGVNVPELGCDGRQNTLIDWSLPYATTLFAHEIGHALGLDHDRPQLPDGSSCPAGLMSAVPPANMSMDITGYCAFVDRMNNDRAPCNSMAPSPTESHPCEVGLSRQSGGNPGGTEGLGDEFCETFPSLCDEGPGSWRGGAPECHWFCVSTMGSTSCEWWCFAPPVARRVIDVDSEPTEEEPHSAPVLVLDQPAEGATLSGIVTLSGFAHEFFHMPQLLFFIDGQSIPVTDVQTGLHRPGVIWHPDRNENSGFSVKLDTRRVPNGAHTLQVLAMDIYGFPTRVDRPIVTNNTCSDTTPPVLSVAVPSNPSGTVTVTANATDDVGVTEVEFRIGGVRKLIDTTAPFTYVWETSGYPAGEYWVEAFALDACGNRTYDKKIVNLGSQADAAQFISVGTIPPAMTSGQSATVSVTVKNIGSSTWTAAGLYKLGSTNPDNNTTWGMSRVNLAAGDSIAPGAQKTFSWTITAPPAAGIYPFQWRMVKDPNGWFGDASPVKSITVTQPPAPPSARNDRAKTKRDTPVTINVLANDRDPQGQNIFLTNSPITTPPRHGTAVRLSNTSVQYTPDAQFAGNDVFEYEIVNAGGDRDRAWVAVHVGRTRDLPVAVDDNASTDANRSKTINVVANDYSPDGDAIALTAAPVIQNAAHGVVTRVSDTSLSYIPDHDFTGTDSFAYEISDSERGTAAAFVTITVTDVNRPPVAVDDTAATGVGAAVTIDVVVNDTDPDGDPLVLTANPIVVSPLHGTAQRVSPTTIVYTPNPGYVGSDSFEYEIGDGQGSRDRGTVTISVSNTNHPPDAVDDTAVTSAGVAVTVDVVANDSDLDGDHVTLITNPIVTAPTNGTAVKISDTSITYTPRGGFSGTDRFQYEIGDLNGGRSRAWVDVTIGPGTPNRNPVAVDDTVTTKTGITADIVVTANDSDPDGDTVSLISNPIIVPPAHGTATKISATTIRYVPAAGYVGADTFQYEIGDGNGKRARAWVKVTVRDPNSRPVAVDDVAFTTPGHAVTVRVTANDYDSDGDPIVVVSNTPIVVPPVNGTATKVAADSIRYVPNAGFTGSDRFQYEIGDGRGGRDRAWVNITVSPSVTVEPLTAGVPPIADNDRAEGQSDGAVPVVVLANDYAVDGRRVVLAANPVVTQPLFGTIQRTSDTTLTYKPGAGFRGNDRFEYELIDDYGTTTHAWVVVQIPGENHPPVAAGDDVAVPMDNSTAIAPLYNDTDPDGDVLALSERAITVAPLHGTVRRNGDLELIYTPLRDYSGDDLFTYEISDGRGGIAVATVVVHVLAKQPPLARNDSATVNTGTPITINVLANDTDPDGDALHVTASQPPEHGSIVWNEDGTATYVSHPGYAGGDSFTYTVSDPAGMMSQAVVAITVVLPNRPPVVAADTAETKTRTAVLIGVLANDYDPDYPTKLRVVSVSVPAHGTATINWNGESVTYTPANDFAGVDTFTYTVSDNVNSVTGNVTVTVPNAAPQPRSEVLAAPEDTWVGYTAWHVLANDVDPDGDELHITSIEQPANGTFLISPDKTQFSYQSKANWFGMDTFYYTVSDPFGASVRVMAQISVSSINDAPVAVNDSFSVYKNQVLTLTQAQIVANDTDVEGQAISVYSVGAPTNGTAQKLADGTIEYRPYGEFVGTDSFEYTIEDSGGGAYGFGRINVTVLQDTPPVPSFTVSCVNLACTFDASASTDDRGIVMYQWLLGNGQAAAGKTFTYSYATTGTYQVRLTVQDALGQTVATTKAVTVTCPLPSITVQPASRATNYGQPTTLSVTASNATSYQWYQGASGTTTTPVGTNSSSLTVTLYANASYWVKVNNGCGSTNSATATVTVCTPPSIVTQPASQTIMTGSSTTLSVAAGGSGPFTYQWYEGASGTTTTPVGVNSSSFTTPVFATATTKSYWVRVTSACNSGVVNSATATITVSAAQIARRQFAGSTANSMPSITTNWTQPTQAGTLLVAIVSAERSWYPIANWAPPAGWQLARTYEMTHVKTSIYYYPNNPGGRTSETFGNGGYWDDMILQLAEYTGAATTSPLDKTALNGNTFADGYIDTGYTAQTVQPKELVITALTAYAQTDFFGPSQGFVELDDRNQGFGNLTTAVHEKIVTTAGLWGHSAQTTFTGEWIGLVVTFKAAN